MGSMNLSYLRKEYPGLTDVEIAQKLVEADDSPYVFAIGYTSPYAQTEEMTDIGLGIVTEEYTQYINLKNAKVLYDRRQASHIPQSKKNRAGRSETIQARLKEFWEKYKDKRDSRLKEKRMRAYQAEAERSAMPAQTVSYDGVYRTKDEDDTWHYLRFYDDGTVIGITTPGTPQEIEEWFVRENIKEKDLSYGQYQIIGNRLVFSTDCCYGVVEYEGTIKKEVLDLNYKSHICNMRGRDRYKFYTF